MFEKWLTKWKEWNQPPPDLVWLQVELTTHCNACCTYCPRTVAGSSWHNRHMEMNVFQRLLPSLPFIPYIHLQGWGEPLLHPDFFPMVNLVVQSGSQCGTTSNGVLIDGPMARRLVDSGLHVIGLSLTGTGKCHDRFRPGASVAQLKKALFHLAKARKETKKTTPSIHIAYLLMAEGIDELDGLPDLLDGSLVSQFVISTLDYIPSPELSRQAIAENTPHALLAKEKIIALRQRLSSQGIQVACHLLDTPHHTALSTCSEQVHQTLLLGIDGHVFPCVFAKMPPPAGKNELCFGNLQHSSLQQIWNSEPYRRFRASFRNGTLNDVCRTCLKRIS